MNEASQLINTLNEAFAKIIVSKKTFAETQKKNSDNFKLVLAIARDKKKIEAEEKIEIKASLNRINDMLTFREEIKEAILQAKLIYASLKEIEAHLLKASVYDTIGASYYETQVLKQFIKDEIAILDRVIPQIHQNLEVFEIVLEDIQSESVGLKIELRNNIGIIPLKDLGKKIDNIKAQTKLSPALSICRSCIEYIGEYLSIILIENHRLTRDANYRIEQTIALYVKHYVDGSV